MSQLSFWDTVTPDEFKPTSLQMKEVVYKPFYLVNFMFPTSNFETRWATLNLVVINPFKTEDGIVHNRGEVINVKSSSQYVLRMLDKQVDNGFATANEQGHYILSSPIPVKFETAGRAYVPNKHDEPLPDEYLTRQPNSDDAGNGDLPF